MNFFFKLFSFNRISKNDYQTVKLILNFYLLNRKRKIVGNVNITEKLSNFFIPFTYGLLLSALISIISLKYPFFSMISFFSVVMFYIFVSLISDFPELFLESDSLMIFPIKPKLINLAKYLFILILILEIIVPFSLSSIVAFGIILSPVTSLLIMFGMILSAIFTISFVYLLYGILLKIFPTNKIITFLNYFRMVVIAFLGIVSLLFSFLFGNNYLKNINIDILLKIKTLWFYPPVWFASLGILQIVKDYKSQLMIFSLIGLFSSLFLFYIYSKLIAKGYERNLNDLKYNIKKGLVKPKKSLRLLFDRSELGIWFDFACKMITGDRKLKFLLLTNIAYFSIITLFYPVKSLIEHNAILKTDKSYFVIYLIILSFVNLLIFTRYHSYYKAKQMFLHLPIKSPANLFKSTFLAIVIKYQIPAYLVISLVYIYFYGYNIMPELLIVFLNNLNISLFFMVLSGKIQPFSKPFNKNNSPMLIEKAFILIPFVFLPIAAGIHFISTLFPYGKYLLVIILTRLLFYLWKKTFKDVEWQSSLM